MKMLKHILILTLITGGLIFARTGKDLKRSEGKNLKDKIQYYWVKDHSDENNNQLERKRSNKRRRRVKKPVKGLR